MKRPNEALTRTNVRAVILLMASILWGHAQNPPNRALRGAAIDSPPQTNAVPADNQQKSHSRAVPASVSAGKNEYVEAGFDKLASYTATVTYEVVDADKPSFYYAPRLVTPIPDWIKEFDGKKVSIKGFMLPLKQNDGLVIEFILLKNQQLCCFGKPPSVNEWVHVRMKGEGVKTLMDQPVTISGKLQVAQYKENKTLLGIYQMDGEKMTGPQ